MLEETLGPNWLPKKIWECPSMDNSAKYSFFGGNEGILHAFFAFNVCLVYITDSCRKSCFSMPKNDICRHVSCKIEYHNVEFVFLNL